MSAQCVGETLETRVSVCVSVRAARREDMPVVHRMIQELAAFEGVPAGPTLTAEDLERDGFDSSPPWFFGLIAECGGPESGGRRVVGHALCNRAYSSWTRRAFYVEDLYVEPGVRSLGVGTRILQCLCQMAVEEGVHRIDWHVLESNARALSFYERIGARDLRLTEGRAALRLDADAIRALAAEGPK